MRRQFAHREELVDYLRQQFPQAAQRDPHVSATRGGRSAAESALERIQPDRYGFTRNHLNGAVSRLSMYIRHGVLSLAEVRDAALDTLKEAFHGSKFITELAWREYWQRLYQHLGTGIWRDQEAYKTGLQAKHYAETLPDDISAGETGLACMDGFALELRQTGYLHNHARMWVAAYVVHWRRVRWQAGARWFLSHLLDGDPASNNLSWQWVASTFSHKPYFFNRENLEKYTSGSYCSGCASAARCPFDATYAELETRLFPHRPGESEAGLALHPRSSGSLHRDARHPRKGRS
jgi:deoxyribodipyrimidine photo-lyase